MTASLESHAGDQPAERNEINFSPLPSMSRWPLAGAILVDPGRHIAYEGHQGIVIQTPSDNMNGALVFSPITATLETGSTSEPQPDGEVGIILHPQENIYAVRLQFLPDEPRGGNLQLNIPVDLKEITEGAIIGRMGAYPNNTLRIQVGRRPDDLTTPFDAWEQVDARLLKTLFPPLPKPFIDKLASLG